jgi:hypothetical protein
VQETWTTPDGALLIVDYDQQGIARISREALAMLAVAAGLTLKERSETP